VVLPRERTETQIYAETGALVPVFLSGVVSGVTLCEDQICPDEVAESIGSVLWVTLSEDQMVSRRFVSVARAMIGSRLHGSLKRDWPNSEPHCSLSGRMHPLTGQPMQFVAIDIETANADMASICAVGAAIFEHGQLSSQWYSLVDPDDYFDPVNVSIHGIDGNMVLGAPVYKDVAKTIERLLGGRIVVTHIAARSTCPAALASSSALWC